jgi:hypothetical protein
LHSQNTSIFLALTGLAVAEAGTAASILATRASETGFNFFGEPAPRALLAKTANKTTTNKTTTTADKPKPIAPRFIFSLLHIF